MHDDLRRDVAGGRASLGLFDHHSGYEGAEYILDVDEAAVMHLLGLVIHVVEVDDAISRKEKTSRDVLLHLSRHVKKNFLN